mmetsp:Transcript_5953/g.10571  ORF Transcript_5953/g.10571 Transcript_5953/m.10571 type:complete len:322 (-) Transcript_5953:87-1052(-)
MLADCKYRMSMEFDSNEECILGIDEAGRGPVLGPMVYAAAVVSVSKMNDFEKLGCNDSKQLTADDRDHLFQIIHQSGFVKTYVDSMSAEYLSCEMLKTHKVSLNVISHNSAIKLIQNALNDGIRLKHVYVDTVGDPGKYQMLLEKEFGGNVGQFTVAKKADSTYNIVGAASIVAKVTRDRVLSNWKFKEEQILDENGNAVVCFSKNTGSGYPSDPVSQEWMKSSIDNVFGYPNLVRFSWGTTKILMEKHCVRVDWEDDEDDDDSKSNVKKKQKLSGVRPLTEYFGSSSATASNTKSQNLSSQHNPLKPSIPLFFRQRSLAP